MSERVDETTEVTTAATTATALSEYRRGVLSPSEVQGCLDLLRDAAIQLYGEDLRDRGVQAKLAALGENEMFKRVFYHAQRASLEFALSQVEGKLTGVRA